MRALLIHNAETPEPLKGRGLKDLARQFTGFGLPAATAQMLETSDHQITLVFESTLPKGEPKPAIMRFAFALARSRPRKLLTVVTKSNAQRHAMVMWDEIAVQVAKEFPDVTWDKELVDAATARMVNRPATLDTIVATNLHADILSDLAAALAGSLGIAPTGNIDPERRYPSMFEPIHGSAFDIMGKGVANPVGTFWSAVMMLEHLGEKDAADRLMNWAESTYPRYFAPAGAATQTIAPYSFRYYATTNAYLGVANGTVYYMDAFLAPGTIIPVGSVDSFMPLVQAAGF